MSPVYAAPLQMADLVAVMRPDWDRTAFQQALDACRFAHTDDDGWDWARTFRLVAAHLADPAASPRDLAAAARGPFARDVPGDYGSRAAEARRLLGYDTGSGS
jgi:hypothetical protein